MRAFIARFRDELALRREALLYEQQLKFAKRKADQMRSEGATASQIADALSAKLGCPCCGPAWWRDIVKQAFREENIPLPLELQEA